MSFPDDPVRWTASPDDAPEGLRSALSAASREGPSDVQMKMLALKLAALSAGTAAAASAATAKAAVSTAGGAATAKTAGSFTVAKVLASLALAGAGTAGVVAYRAREGGQVERQTPRTVQQATAAEEAQEVAAPAVVPQEPPSPVVAAPEVAAPSTDAVEPQRSGERSPALRTSTRQAPKTKRSVRLTRAEQRRHKAAQKAEAHARAKHTLETEVVEPAPPGVPSEVELLRRARAALASRPREAFALTEQHREHYARGTFVQERDALAIEALMRAGEMDMARDLARRFVRTYPGSPHAHRFRETMGLD